MATAITSDHYHFFDKQLADLLLRLCTKLGSVPDAEQRTRLTTLVQHCSAATRNGIIALPLREVAADMPDDTVSVDALTDLLALPVVGTAGDYAPLIIEDGHVWLNRYWQYEQRLATALQQRLQTLPLTDVQAAAIRQRLATWHSLSSSTADAELLPVQQDWQQQAVAMAACSRFLIISGGPGTGKTTTVIRLLWLLIEQMQVNPQKILLAAPTGKAAMRLQESIRQAKNTLDIPPDLAAQIPEQARTLHRLLGFIPGQVNFRHNRHNPLVAEMVIVDEASMIDISLMTKLFEAVPANARLVLLGDKDQLAAVETGSIFRDLCVEADNQYSAGRQALLDYLCTINPVDPHNKPLFPHEEGPEDEAQTDSPFHALNDHIVILQKSWRFAADSGIGQLAAAIRDGQENRLTDILNKQWPDIHYDNNSSLELQSLLQVWDDYLQLVHQRPDNDRNRYLQMVFTAFNRFRILTPLRKGLSGTEPLNNRISEFIRHHTRQTAVTVDKHWFAGRPVMVTQNDYRQHLFNGDIGLTLADSSGQLRVWFPDQEGFRAIAPVRLPAHETAWCMTIHKSQGSEFDEILLILPEQEDNPILGRELLYTGITRAKKKIRILGQRRVIHHALQKTLPPSSRIYQRLHR